MTTWDGGDGDDFDDLDDLLEPRRDFREEVEAADPEPVTEAMITPRTQPMVPAPEPTGEQICPVCDERNDPHASYCLACGVRLSDRPDEQAEAEPAMWEDEDDLEFDAGAGLLEPDEMDALAAPAEDAEAAPAPAAAGPRITGRQIIIGLLTAAIAVLLFVTFQSQGDEPDETTTTTALEDPSVMSAYLASLNELVTTVTDIDADAAQINADWDDRVADYQTTLSAMRALETRAAGLPDLVSGLEPPASISAAAHRGLVDSITTFADAASEMVVGLEAPDTGEARRAAFLKLQAAASEFGSRVRTVDQPAPTTTTATSG